MRNIFFLIGRGFRNIIKNPMTSFFSLLVMVTTIFLFCTSYATLINIRSVVKQAEDSVGITVFFDEGLSDAEIRKIGQDIGAREEVARMVYTSAEEAWENFKEIYFKGNEELADGFIDDNPLANSASYEVFLANIADQQDFVEELERIEGVRKVNASNLLADGLNNLGRIIEAVTIAVVTVLLIISVMLISNSISVAIAMRKDEIHIMRYIGATNRFIRFPFVLEGMIIGLIGAAIPLAVVWYFYDPVVHDLSKRLMAFGTLLNFLKRAEVFKTLLPIALVLSIGIGVVGSIFSMRRHLKA
ncbi:MAG: ABC transporter permease [Lachnospiraceae bacterium]|nr:ABC transporter permease [Lachnospiraceae bacterium]